MTPQGTTTQDLLNHPDIIPLLDLEGDKVVCFGWVSPIYEFSPEDFDAA